MVDENQNKTDGTGLLIAAKRAAAENYLGDQKTVDRLVRDFASAVIERFNSVAQGRMLPNDASAADVALCQKMADVFLGKAAGYTTVPGWNEAALPLYVRARFSEIIQPEDDRSVIAQAFALLAHVIYDQIRSGTDANAMGNEIDGSIKSLTNLLLGIGEHD